MTSPRARLRAALAQGTRVTGTFVKLPAPDVVELCGLVGFDFAVVDMEHSTLSEAEALGLVRHAERCGLPALVRIPEVDAPLVCRLLENGAAGFQLSMLASAAQTRALVRATRFAPEGARSVSLANRAAGFGLRSSGGLKSFLAAERDVPPLLVGQIETPWWRDALTARTGDPWEAVIGDLDVVFVGGTDLAVSLGADPGGDDLRTAVAEIEKAAERHGVAFGGWAPSRTAARGQGLAGARYLVTGSDLQILAAGLEAAAAEGGGNG
ncbi:aldolase/citrate lyase family protein [Actinomadura sp. 7K507]|uniref:HpcH/HpaI aldolase family protein n=1 Tax=Actinomadura sp. 7K507 TaxID=2530365 RepID=UPI0014055547|nr:aldolase/citrate lyase family protein [Actinomadura sp. 7K507]